MIISPIQFNFIPGVVSQKAFGDHISLYQKYVDKTNEITNKLHSSGQRDEADKNFSYYRALKKEQNFNLNAVLIHEMFFRNIGKTQEEPGKCFIDFINKSLGNFHKWKDDFIACAKASRGWVLTCYDQRTCTIQNILHDTYNEDLRLSAYPLIVLDMYEHAYFLDYQLNIKDYIECFIKNLNWKVVEERCECLDG